MDSRRVLVDGEATGRVVVLEEPLSFWGGFDVESGRVVGRHAQRDLDLAGSVLVMPTGRGSSSSSSVLAEAIKAGTAPAAIVMAQPDVVVALGAIVARELYKLAVPIIVVDAATYGGLSGAETATIRHGGELSFS